jgi:hypothetical protein
VRQPGRHLAQGGELLVLLELGLEALGAGPHAHEEVTGQGEARRERLAHDLVAGAEQPARRRHPGAHLVGLVHQRDGPGPHPGLVGAGRDLVAHPDALEQLELALEQHVEAVDRLPLLEQARPRLDGDLLAPLGQPRHLLVGEVLEHREGAQDLDHRGVRLR